MATITSEEFVGTKKWSEGAAWIGGAAPGIKDDAILKGTGTLEVTTAVKVKSIDGETFKGVLKFNEKTIQVAQELEGAGLGFRWGTEMKVESVGVGALELPGAKSSTPELTSNGTGTGRAYRLLIKSSAAKVKLLDALVIGNGGYMEISRCSDFLSESKTIETPELQCPGELATTIHLAKSTVKITAGGAIAFGEGVTLTASEATIEGTSTAGFTLEAAKNHTIGTVVATHAADIKSLGNIPRSLAITTLKMDNGGNASEAERTVRLSAEATVNLTTWTTNASSEAKRVVIKSTTAGVEAKVKKAAGKVELDYVEVKDNHAEGEVPFKALSHSVLGTGNTNWELVTEGAVEIAGTCKIKLKDSAALEQILGVKATSRVKLPATLATVQTSSVAGTTKQTIKTSQVVSSTTSVAGTSKVRLNATAAPLQNVTLAGTTQVTFGTAAKVTVVQEGAKRAIIMIFEE